MAEEATAKAKNAFNTATKWGGKALKLGVTLAIPLTMLFFTGAYADPMGATEIFNEIAKESTLGADIAGNEAGIGSALWGGLKTTVVEGGGFALTKGAPVLAESLSNSLGDLSSSLADGPAQG